MKFNNPKDHLDHIIKALNVQAVALNKAHAAACKLANSLNKEIQVNEEGELVLVDIEKTKKA